MKIKFDFQDRISRNHILCYYNESLSLFHSRLHSPDRTYPYKRHAALLIVLFLKLIVTEQYYPFPEDQIVLIFLGKKNTSHKKKTLCT